MLPLEALPRTQGQSERRRAMAQSGHGPFLPNFFSCAATWAEDRPFTESVPKCAKTADGDAVHDASMLAMFEAGEQENAAPRQPLLSCLSRRGAPTWTPHTTCARRAKLTEGIP
jgi:hypothetical protein